MSITAEISVGPRSNIMARVLLPLPLQEAAAMMKAMASVARKRGKQAVCFQEGELLIFEEKNIEP